ncbi:cutinase family protein [Aeromicrobium sp. 179-A 4D2 NHS]|uniref:cutinase family protein n=1 Tax=Aeromicrobium sp. 179-A 4D2 NHS TaxID=3142375 RepID=UPI0039A3F6FE
MRGFHHLRRATAGLAASIMAASGLIVLTSTPAQAACTAWTIIGVRGTNDGTKASLGTQLPTAVSAFKAKKGSANVTTQYVSYPADVWPSWDDGAYTASLKAGRTALKSKITTRLKDCPSTKLALFGYSQGAHVVGDVVVGLSATQRKSLQGVGLIGDPMFNPGLKGSRTGDTKHGGMLGRRASWPSDVYVYDVCNKKDQICASYSTAQSFAYLVNPFASPKEHLSYTTTTYSPVKSSSGTVIAGAKAIGERVATRTY